LSEEQAGPEVEPPGGDSTADDAAHHRTIERHPPSRRVLSVVIVLAIISYAAANVGDAIAPDLIERGNYELLLALNARLRNLALTVNELSPAYYYVVGGLRTSVSDPLFYLLGYWYGDAAVSWMEQRMPSTGRWIRQYEKWFREASYLVVAVAPSSLVCVLAGSAGMHPLGFLAVNVGGTIVRLLLVDWLGAQFEETISDITDWIGDHRLYLLPITIGLVVVAVGRDLIRGKRDIEVLHEIAEDAEEAAARGEGEAP
jgi:membrane protein DedA with SNARE-associated domain